MLGGIGLAGLAATGLLPVATAQHSPFATPAALEATGAALDGPLGSLLASIPAVRVESQSQGSFWTYSDIARQFQALGMTHSIDGPDTENEPFLHATYALAAAGNLLNFALDEELAELIGFRPLGLDQMIYVGNPPYQLQLLRAPFDTDALAAAWQASGYEERTATTGETIWTIGPERELGFDNPIQRRMLSDLNNLVVIGDMIVASPELAAVDQVLVHLAEGGPSLLEEPITGPLASELPETTVSATALPASALSVSPFDIEAIDAQADEIEAIRVEFGLMPPIEGMIAGVNEGAIIVDSDWSPDGTPVATPRPDAGTAFWYVNAGTPQDAEQVRAITEARWNRLRTLSSGAPYADYMEMTRAEIDANLVEFDFRMLTNPSNWHQFIFGQDMLPLAPDDPSA